MNKNRAILLACLGVLVAGGLLWIGLTDRSSSTAVALSLPENISAAEDLSEIEIVKLLNANWEKVQELFPPPSPDLAAVQFLRKNVVLIQVGGDNLYLAVLELKGDKAYLRQIFRDQDSLPFLEWEQLVREYEGAVSALPTYLKFFVRDGQIVTMPEFTEVAETIFFSRGKLAISKIADGKAKVMDKAKLFSVELPAGWIIDERDNNFPELSSFSAKTPDYNVRSDDSADGPCTPSYYESGAQAAFQVNLGPSSHDGEGGGTNVGVSSETKVVVDGIEGTYHVLKPFCAAEGQVLDVHLNHKDRWYGFSFGYNPKNYPDAEKVFKEILDSVKFLD